MNILILNGSPTGDGSITLQTMHYIREFFPEHSYEILNVGQRIKAIEKDFSSAKEMLEKAELILFCYPVYTFLVPSQLHRFIELIKEQGIDLGGKYASQLSTSKHFYDTTAHEFIRENCADLGLKYVRGLSADMEDLLKKRGRRRRSTGSGMCSGLPETIRRKHPACRPGTGRSSAGRQSRRTQSSRPDRGASPL